MKVFVIISSLLAVATASTGFVAPRWYGYAPAAAYYAAPAELSSQYHSQDNLGQYSYGYDGGLSAKAETKSLDGVTRGSYSYLDAENKRQTVTYTADALNGFRAQATNLPQAPAETRMAPESVQDTPEVAQAKADHMAAFEKAKLSNAAAVDESATLAYASPAPISLAPASGFSPLAIASYATQAPIAAIAPSHLSYAWNHAPAYAYSYGAHAFYDNRLYARTLPLAQDLPQPVQDTPEVAQAKLEHFKAVAEAKARALK
ncbi:hypothetical protein RP20_CCG024935 [Aedes albopictus]|nr:hypothetical protein RP20_CCG024935 [Aedes albopictus]